MARIAKLRGATVSPRKVRRRGTDRWAALRLVVIMLTVASLATYGAWWYAVRYAPAGVDLVLTDAPVRVLLPGRKNSDRLRSAVNLPWGTVVATNSSARTALTFGSDISLRLAPGSNLRVVRAGPLASNGVEVSLERGRLWLERQSSGIPAVIRTGGYRLHPGVGCAEISHDGRGRVTVLGWTATVWIRDPQGRDLHQVDLNRGGRIAAGTWQPVRLSGRVDEWAAWNMHTSPSDLMSGEILDMEVAYRLAWPPEFDPQDLRPPPAGQWAEPSPPPRPFGEKTPLRLPGLPGPDYPLANRRPGRETPEPWSGRSDPEPGGGAPDRPVSWHPGPDPSARAGGPAPGPRWQMPEGLSWRGRTLPPAGAVDVTRPAAAVRSQSQADRIGASVTSTLLREFGMELELPFRLEVAPQFDEDIRIENHAIQIMSLDRRGNAWVARVAENVLEDEFAAFAAALFAEAWIQEQGVKAKSVEGKGFTRWIAFRYSVAAGNKFQARSIPAQGGNSSAWLDSQYDKGFQMLWDIEEKSGERGVFDRVLGRTAAG